MRDFDPRNPEFARHDWGGPNKKRFKTGVGPLYDMGSIAAIGGNIIGGIIGSDAASDAADAQARAAAASDATQRYFYDTTREDNRPFRDAGVAANNRLAQLMGLNPGRRLTREQLRAEMLGQYTKTRPGQRITNPGPPNWLAGDEQTTPQAIFARDTTEIDEAGLNAAIEARLAQQEKDFAAYESDPAYGSLTRKFSADDLKNDAVYQSGLKFGLDQGVAGINRQAAAGGSFLSGATLKALTRFGNDYGSTKANESYNRFNNDNNQLYNRLAGLSGAGQQATNQISAAGQNAGNQISASQQGAGNARASGYVGQANAWNRALGQGVNAFQQWGMMSNGSSPQTSGYGAGMTGSGTMNELAGYGVF